MKQETFTLEQGQACVFGAAMVLMTLKPPKPIHSMMRTSLVNVAAQVGWPELSDAEQMERRKVLVNLHLDDHQPYKMGNFEKGDIALHLVKPFNTWADLRALGIVLMSIVSQVNGYATSRKTLTEFLPDELAEKAVAIREVIHFATVH